MLWHVPRRFRGKIIILIQIVKCELVGAEADAPQPFGTRATPRRRCSNLVCPEPYGPHGALTCLAALLARWARTPEENTCNAFHPGWQLLFPAPRPQAARARKALSAACHTAGGGDAASVRARGDAVRRHARRRGCRFRRAPHRL